MKKRSMDRTGKLIKLFMDRDLGGILLWQCNGSIELFDLHFLDARNTQWSCSTSVALVSLDGTGRT